MGTIVETATVSNLSKLKKLIESKGAYGLSLYREAKKLGFTVIEINAIRKLKVIDKTKKMVNSRNYGYGWNDKFEPNIQLLNNIQEQANKLQGEAYDRKKAKDSKDQGKLEFEERPKDKPESTPEVKAEEKPKKSRK